MRIPVSQSYVSMDGISDPPRLFDAVPKPIINLRVGTRIAEPSSLQKVLTYRYAKRKASASAMPAADPTVGAAFSRISGKARRAASRWRDLLRHLFTSLGRDALFGRAGGPECLSVSSRRRSRSIRVVSKYYFLGTVPWGHTRLCAWGKARHAASPGGPSLTGSELNTFASVA